jgi:hypothetical protein
MACPHPESSTYRLHRGMRGWCSLIPWPRVRGSANPPCCLSAESTTALPPRHELAVMISLIRRLVRTVRQSLCHYLQPLHNCRKKQVAFHLQTTNTKGSRLRLLCRLRVMNDRIPSARVRCDTTESNHVASTRLGAKPCRALPQPSGGSRSRDSPLAPGRATATISAVAVRQSPLTAS